MKPLGYSPAVLFLLLALAALPILPATRAAACGGRAPTQARADAEAAADTAAAAAAAARQHATQVASAPNIVAAQAAVGLTRSAAEEAAGAGVDARCAADDAAAGADVLEEEAVRLRAREEAAAEAEAEKLAAKEAAVQASEAAAAEAEAAADWEATLASELDAALMKVPSGASADERRSIELSLAESATAAAASGDEVAATAAAAAAAAAAMAEVAAAEAAEAVAAAEAALAEATAAAMAAAEAATDEAAADRAAVAAAASAKAAAEAVVDAEEAAAEVNCGDGRLAPDEECDDGQTNLATDGCSPACRVDFGWVCEGEPSRCRRAPPCAVSIRPTGDLHVTPSLKGASSEPLCPRKTRNKEDCIPIGLVIYVHVNLVVTSSLSMTCPGDTLYNVGSLSEPEYCFGSKGDIHFSTPPFEVKVRGPSVTIARAVPFLGQLHLMKEAIDTFNNVLDTLSALEEVQVVCIAKMLDVLRRQVGETEACDPAAAQDAFRGCVEDQIDDKLPHVSELPRVAREAPPLALATVILPPHHHMRRNVSAPQYPAALNASDPATSTFSNMVNLTMSFVPPAPGSDDVEVVAAMAASAGACTGALRAALQASGAACICSGAVNSTCAVWNDLVPGFDSAGAVCLPTVCQPAATGENGTPAEGPRPRLLYARVAAASAAACGDGGIVSQGASEAAVTAVARAVVGRARRAPLRACSRASTSAPI